MKAKLDSEGLLIIEAESELEAFALDAWCVLNIEGIPDDVLKPDVEIVYNPKRNKKSRG